VEHKVFELSSDLSQRKKINIGCGQDYRDGYLNIDVDTASRADHIVKDHDLSGLPQKHYSEVLAWDILEHIPHAHTMSALLDWAWLLAPNGKLVLQTSYLPGVLEQMERSPGFATDFNWMRCLFGNQAHPGDIHFNCFTKRTLAAYLNAAGFSSPDFTFIDLWLIGCEVEKSRDIRDELSFDVEPAEFVRNAYNMILKREVEDFHLPALCEESQNVEGKTSLLKRLSCCPENLYRIGELLG
jgi:hypothetical protein